MSKAKPARRVFFTENASVAIAAPIEGKPVTLTGYALVWNVLSSDRGGYKVRLLPGSARFAPVVHALWHHEYRDVLGSTANNTLRITPDDVGVRVEIDLPNTSAGRDVAVLVNRGDVRGMSFAMVDDPTVTRTTENGIAVQNASSYLVDEVTVTAIPAFVESTVGIKPGEPEVISYAHRTKQSLQLNRLTLDQYRLPPACAELHR